MNTTDASTTTGFSDIGDGVTWVTEARFQYRLGELPGGMNAGVAYAFDNEFLRLGGAGLIEDDLTIASESTTWTVYWSAWQYVLTLDDPPDVINPVDGRPDVRGLGLFARAGIVDEDTNLVRWSGSIGLGGRGIVPGRDEDIFGIGFGVADFNNDTPLSRLLVSSDGYAMEAFYNAILAPGVALTGDIQMIEPASRGIDTTIVAGVRLNVRF
jgi:porin